ncbi:MAG: cupin domain-containing protein [Actinomycetota bacterium]
MTTDGSTAQHIIERFKLDSHPEGGYYRELWRGPSGRDGRDIGSSILFLLAAGQRSHWHRIDATEIWHFHSGTPLHLHVADPANGNVHTTTLGSVRFDDDDGHRPQAIVPPHHWQAAEPLGDWTLVGCTVTPGFEFAHFELAPPDFTP